MLTVTTEYALRALTQLARNPRGEATLGRDLARSSRVPAKYLSKIMLALRNAGIVGTTRGLGGGYRLARSANAVHLSDVVKVFEGGSTKPTCLLDSARRCSEHHPCDAHPRFHDVPDGLPPVPPPDHPGRSGRRGTYPRCLGADGNRRSPRLGSNPGGLRLLAELRCGCGTGIRVTGDFRARFPQIHRVFHFTAPKTVVDARFVSTYCHIVDGRKG